MPLGGHELLINHWDMPYRLKQASLFFFGEAMY